MASEKDVRAAVHRMGRRLREEHAKAGKPISQEKAADQARKIAERIDRKY